MPQPQPVPVTVTKVAVPVVDGIFEVGLDFTVNAFSGANRFLEISVRALGESTFSILSPREQIHTSPYAIETISAGARAAVPTGARMGLGGGPSSSVMTNIRDARSLPAAAGSTPMPFGVTTTVLTRLLRSTPRAHAAASQAPRAPQVIAGGISGAVLDLGGVASPGLAAPGQGRLYFDAATNKLKLSENGGAFVDLVGGVSGGGTVNTIPLWSTGTTLGTSVITQASGNIGIGTTTPNGRLEVNGNWNGAYGALTVSGDKPSIRFSAGAAAGNQQWLLHEGADNLGNLEFYNGGTAGSFVSPLLAMTPNEQIGIGTAAPGPGLKLDVFGSVRSIGSLSNDLFVETIGATHSWARLNLKTANRQWVLGTSQGENGDQFYLMDQNSGLNSMTADPNGGQVLFPVRVGIMSAKATVASLEVRDDQIGTAIAGITSFGSGVFGQSFSATGWGVYGRNVAGGYAMFAEGNAGQSRNMGGFVKAMAYVDYLGNIIRCFNAMTNSSTLPCGISVNHWTVGGFGVDFGFKVDDRFVAVTAQWNEGDFFGELNVEANLAPSNTSATTIDVHTFQTGEKTTMHDASFMIVVY